MEMVFKNPDIRWKSKWSDADAAMAQAVNAYWVNFAKTGDPNGAGLPVWPTYKAASDSLLNFDKGGPAVISGYGKMRLDAIDAADAGNL
jgi:para-nitrobenzyl esterase